MSKRACRARTTAPVRWAKAPAASRTAAEPAGRPGERDRDRLPALRSRRPPRPETPIFEQARSAGKARAANPFLRRKNAAALACAVKVLADLRRRLEPLAQRTSPLSVP